MGRETCKADSVRVAVTVSDYLLPSQYQNLRPLSHRLEPLGQRPGAVATDPVTITKSG